MRYELLIRPIQDGARFGQPAIGEAIQAADLGEQGTLPAELDLGSGSFRVEGFLREGQEDTKGLDGLNLSFPMGLQAAEGDRAVGLAFELCGALGGQVYDPQVGEVVKPSDHERILACWRRAWAFQADVVGATDLGSGDPGLPEPDKGVMGGRTGLALTIIFGLLMLVYLVRSCSAGGDSPGPSQVHPPVQTGAGE